MNITAVNSDGVLHLKNNIKAICEKLGDVPSGQAEKAKAAIDMCRHCLAEVPETDSPVYVHITGTDKSFKTSYLLDLFDHPGLRELFSVKIHDTSENTAVPCLVEPSNEVTGITVRQLAISTKQILREDLTKQQFIRLYDLASGAEPNDYLLQVLVPKDETPMTLPVIEYPGIKEGADAMAQQQELHETFQKDLLKTLVKFPGVLVACFQHKIAIPIGHPMDIILKKYGEVLKTGFSHHKLPLVISMQGASAVAGYLGNTNVEKDIKNDFSSFQAFDSVIQLVNPLNETYRVTFSEPGPHVENWINNLSRYGSIREIQKAIISDGGISRSRDLLEEICQAPYLQEALDNLFLKPWLIKGAACLEKALSCFNEIATYDEVSEISEKIRVAVIKGRYRSLRYFFNHEMEIISDGVIDNHGNFWPAIFSQYLSQFLEDDKKSDAIARVLWDQLEKRLDSETKGFIGTLEKDLPYIIMNIAELYVPNALIRGEYAIIAKQLEDQINAV